LRYIFLISFVAILLLIPAVNVSSSPVDGIDYYFEPGDDRSVVVNQDKINDYSNLSGSNFVLVLELSQAFALNDISFNTTTGVRYTRVYHNFTDDYLIYIYVIQFNLDGIYTLQFNFVGGVQYVISLDVWNSNYVWISSGEYDELKSNWDNSRNNAGILGDIYGVDYGNTSDSFDSAMKDAIDDVKALRKGPEVFGEGMIMAFLMMFLTPYTWIILLIVLAIVSVSRRKEMEILTKMEKSTRGYDIDETARLVGSKLAQERERELMADTANVCCYFGIPQKIWRMVVVNYPTVGSFLAAISEVKLTSSGKITECDFTKNYRKWIQMSVQLRYGADLDVSLTEAFSDVVNSIMTFVIVELHFVKYKEVQTLIPYFKEYGDRIASDFVIQKESGGSALGDIAETASSSVDVAKEMADSLVETVRSKL